MSCPAPECPVRQEDLDCIEELGLGVTMLILGLGLWWLLTSPKSVWSTGWGLVLVASGILVSIEVAVSRFLRARTGRGGGWNIDCPKLDRAWDGVLAGYFVVALFQTPGSPPGDFSLSAAFLGLVPIAFYAKKFAADVSWKRLVAVILIAETTVVAALPPAFLASLVHPSWTSKAIPLSLPSAAILLYTFFGLTFLFSGGLSLWRSRRPIAPAPQEPE